MESPLFVKTHDFLLWLFRTTAKFPKNLRHSLTEDLENSALRFRRYIGNALRYRGQRRRDAFDDADAELDMVRELLSLVAELKVLDKRRYAHAVESTAELGRLLGGWRKGTGRR